MDILHKKKRNIIKAAQILSESDKKKLLLGYIRLFVIGGLTIGIASAVFFIVIKTRVTVSYVVPPTEVAVVLDEPIDIQFPVGVDPRREEIIENPVVESFFTEHISTQNDLTNSHTSWFMRAFGRLALMNWYQNIASLSTRVLVIQAGERKEQIADHFTKILKWDETEKREFLSLITEAQPVLEDGKFFPGIYTVSREASPIDVATLVTDRFNSEILSRYGDEVESTVPLSDALIIASLLEREAYDFVDMRQISGVIWNRLFADMRLQIDATLQYAKGSNPHEAWWPKVVPSDKHIASVYNTYTHKGLPPTPIANSSVESVLAALNPKKTDCMFYFHDASSNFHCTKTYEEHVKLLKQYYGRGR